MPETKYKLYRLLVIDKCLRHSFRSYTMQELMMECNKILLKKGCKDKEISIRTTQKNVQELQVPPFNMVLDAEALAADRYRYADRNQKLDLLNLSDEEKSALGKTIDKLGEIGEDSLNSQYLWLHHCLSQMQKGYPPDVDEDNISFGVNADFTGMKFFVKAMRIVTLKEPVVLRYKPYVGDEELIFHLHPYHLRQYNNRWFLFGRAKEREGISTFALDRITKISTWRTAFVPYEEDFVDYFYDIVGVSVPEGAEPEEIKLKISNSRFPYLDTKPIHGSYREVAAERTDTHHVIQLNLIVNNEFTALLLSLGPDAEVLSPQWLRDSIAEKVSELNKIYHPAQETCAKKQ